MAVSGLKGRSSFGGECFQRLPPVVQPAHHLPGIIAEHPVHGQSPTPIDISPGIHDPGINRQSVPMTGADELRAKDVVAGVKALCPAGRRTFDRRRPSRLLTEKGQRQTRRYTAQKRQ